MSFKILDWISLFLGGISTIFYINVILVIAIRRKRSPFSGHFFKLFIVEGILNIICFVLVLIFVKIRKSRALSFLDSLLLEQSEGFLPSFIIAILSSIRIALCIEVVLFASNRYVAFSALTLYDEVWKDRYLGLTLLLQLLVILPETYMHYVNGFYKYVVLGPHLAIFVPTKKLHKLQSLVGTITTLITVIISSTLYMLIFIKLKQLNQVKSTRNDAEKGILISCLLPFVVLLISLILDLVAHLSQSNNPDFLVVYNELWYVMTDALCLVSPFSLVLTCRSVRQAVFDSLHLKRLSKALSAQEVNLPVTRPVTSCITQK
ncbi:hypothetical protein Tcan_10015 [Toxocara canis]|uniref:Serpentine receptor class gamma n=1 Tax=Toxocara canis TaxID=6265 RepID=A0A0B2VWB9_TOXCA|nr:hypothetical protein Tcan_10015 [Toxocara canis]